MQSSTRTRRKAAFVPWLAALVIGATVHAGWLLHELRESESRPIVAAIHVEVDAGPCEARADRIARAREPALARARHVRVALPESDDEHDLDLWIHRIDRYTYTIDRRVLDRIAVADLDARALERLGIVARSLGLAEPIELRNIRAGTPLFVLGLRTGDRVHAISTRGAEALERVEVAIERRGRPIELVYQLI
jgi:hypothetical protein